MKRVPYAFITLSSLVSRGIILPGEADLHLRRNGTMSSGSSEQSLHHTVHMSQRPQSTHYGHVVEASTKSSDKSSPNLTYKPVLLERRLGSISTTQNDSEYSTGSVIGVMVIVLCVLVMCCFIMMELQVGEPKSASEYRAGHAIQQPPRSTSPRFPPRFAATAGSFTPSMPGGDAAPSGAPNPVAGGYSGQSVIHSSANTPGGRSLTDLRNLIFAPFSSRQQVPKSVYETKPAPICPELVLVVESWYAVGFESIDSASGPVPIYGRGQKLLLTAQIQKQPGSGQVVLTMGDVRGPVLGSIVTAPGGHLVIQDKSKRQYGELASHGHLAYSLTCGGVEVMRISTDGRTGRALLVNPYDGTHLASAAKLHDHNDLPSPEDHLGIAVVAGMDPVLTILCVIGAMALTS